MKTSKRQRFWFSATLALAIQIGAAYQTAQAGQTVIHNTSDKSISCQTSGKTVATAEYFSRTFEIAPSQTARLPADPHAPQRSFDGLECEGLNLGSIHTSRGGHDHTLVYNGNAERTLRVLLYPYLPSNPNGNFGAMLARIVSEYQAQYPEVMLHPILSMDSQYDVYDWENFVNIYGPPPNGFDFDVE